MVSFAEHRGGVPVKCEVLAAWGDASRRRPSKPGLLAAATVSGDFVTVTLMGMVTISGIEIAFEQIRFVSGRVHTHEFLETPKSSTASSSMIAHVRRHQSHSWFPD